MNTPADIEFLPHVLEWLAGQAADRSRDRRVAPRFGLRGSAQMTPVDGGQFPRRRPVRVRDVSRHGIGLIAGEPVEAGIQFELQFSVESGEPDGEGTSGTVAPPLSVFCRVQHCRRIADHSHRIGAQVLRASIGAAAAHANARAA